MPSTSQWTRIEKTSLQDYFLTYKNQSKTGKQGYPDKNGRVWVPPGGPHWDVVDPKGNHKNVLPGGRIR